LNGSRDASDSTSPKEGWISGCEGCKNSCIWNGSVCRVWKDFSPTSLNWKLRTCRAAFGLTKMKNLPPNLPPVCAYTCTASFSSEVYRESRSTD
jgi:hypothetical protein